MADVYTELRPLLFAIAYRMLGSVGDAEDVVQEAFLRYHRYVSERASEPVSQDSPGARSPAPVSEGQDVESPKAFLSAITTRLAIDHLRSARVRRETYVGNWLPEPLLTGSGTAAPDPAEHSADADSLSMTFLLVLERLSPVERAVFLLHDVFDYEFTEIASIVGKSPDNCRQVAVRARKHVSAHRPRFAPSRTERDRLADRFVAALEEGDVAALVDLLAADVVLTGDSGGLSPSWPREISGREKVARLLGGVSTQTRLVAGIHLERLEVNGQPGAAFRDGEGRLVSVFAFDIADGAVRAIRSVINREKLRHLGPLADIPALVAERDRARGLR